jgi:acetylornithine/succinyldiaminopimelate/putrescine aminotransferase
VDPDAISLAKSLGSGYPIGAVVSGAKLGDVFRPGKHASTFGGTPLACAAALATVEVIEEEDLVQKAAVNGKRFMQGLQGLADKYDRVSGVRGKGLMVGLVLDREALPMQKLLVDMGLLCLATAGNVLRFLPPLNVKESEIDDAVDMIDECLEAWHEGEVVEPAPETETAAEDAPAAEPGSDEADETDGDEGDAGNEADTTEARE